MSGVDSDVVWMRWKGCRVVVEVAIWMGERGVKGALWMG